MKQSEAIELIRTQIEAGKGRDEISEILMSQDKIGTANPTDEIIAELFERAADVAKAPAETPVAPPVETPTKARAAKRTMTQAATHEKWKCEITLEGNIGEKQKKLRDVRISDEHANMLNRAAAQGRGYVVQYFKK
jgi:hypothetical protein